MSTSIYAGLSRVVDVLSIEDSGEFGNARCPHCGAEGRYVIHFLTEDGERRGAMRGCFGKFRQHPVAKVALAMRDKEKDYALKGWSLSSFDQRINGHLDAMRSGAIDPDAAYSNIQCIQSERAAWHKRRRY